MCLCEQIGVISVHFPCLPEVAICMETRCTGPPSLLATGDIPLRASNSRSLSIALCKIVFLFPLSYLL